jgi:hypothetical protein
VETRDYGPSHSGGEDAGSRRGQVSTANSHSGVQIGGSTRGQGVRGSGTMRSGATADSRMDQVNQNRRQWGSGRHRRQRFDIRGVRGIPRVLGDLGIRFGVKDEDSSKTILVKTFCPPPTKYTTWICSNFPQALSCTWVRNIPLRRVPTVLRAVLLTTPAEVGLGMRGSGGRIHRWHGGQVHRRSEGSQSGAEFEDGRHSGRGSGHVRAHSRIGGSFGDVIEAEISGPGTRPDQADRGLSSETGPEDEATRTRRRSSNDTGAGYRGFNNGDQGTGAGSQDRRRRGVGSRNRRGSWNQVRRIQHRSYGAIRHSGRHRRVRIRTCGHTKRFDFRGTRFFEDGSGSRSGTGCARDSLTSSLPTAPLINSGVSGRY